MCLTWWMPQHICKSNYCIVNILWNQCTAILWWRHQLIYSTADADNMTPSLPFNLTISHAIHYTHHHGTRYVVEEKSCKHKTINLIIARNLIDSTIFSSKSHVMKHIARYNEIFNNHRLQASQIHFKRLSRVFVPSMTLVIKLVINIVIDFVSVSVPIMWAVSIDRQHAHKHLDHLEYIMSKVRKRHQSHDSVSQSHYRILSLKQITLSSHQIGNFVVNVTCEWDSVNNEITLLIIDQMSFASDRYRCSCHHNHRCRDSQTVTGLYTCCYQNYSYYSSPEIYTLSFIHTFIR
jgi:hypothetical protein